METFLMLERDTMVATFAQDIRDGCLYKRVAGQADFAIFSTCRPNELYVIPKNAASVLTEAVGKLTFGTPTSYTRVFFVYDHTQEVHCTHLESPTCTFGMFYTLIGFILFWCVLFLIYRSNTIYGEICIVRNNFRRLRRPEDR